MVEVPKEMIEKIYKLVESVKVDGKLRKGTNETTKAIEKNEAKLVIAASDVEPKEIVMHFPIISKEAKIPFIEVSSKTELGAAAGLPVSTSSVAIVSAGESKKELSSILRKIKELTKSKEKGKKTEEKKEEKKEKTKEKKEAPKKEDSQKDKENKK